MHKYVLHKQAGTSPLHYLDQVEIGDRLIAEDVRNHFIAVLSIHSVFCEHQSA
jgi:hypothetical protein